MERSRSDGQSFMGKSQLETLQQPLLCGKGAPADQLLAGTKAAQLEAEYQGLSKDKDGLEHQLRIEKQVNMEAIDANRKLSEKSAHITAAVREEHERELALMKTVYEKERELLELDVGQREAVIKLLKEGRSVAEVEEYERGHEQDFGESELGRTRY